MIKEEIRFANNNVMEGMVSFRGVIEAMKTKKNYDRRITKVYFDRSRIKNISGHLSYIKAMSYEFGFDVIAAEKEDVDKMCIGSTHGGIVFECSDRTYPNITEYSLKKDGFAVILDGIEDPYNFGYALRSLYAAGADGVILSPRNWMGAAGVVARASAGASEMIPMYVDDDSSCVEIFKGLGYKVICAGIRNSVSIYDADMKKPVFLIIGGEKRGISSSLLEKADSIVRIDYASGFRGSLSAASSAAIIGFEVMHQNNA